MKHSYKYTKHSKVLCSSALPLLRKLRPVQCDKRDFGHLLAVVGSRELGGAALMCARAALRSGVGLLTCCVPESLHASFVSACPEAMWVPMMLHLGLVKKVISLMLLQLHNLTLWLIYLLLDCDKD